MRTKTLANIAGGAFALFTVAAIAGPGTPTDVTARVYPTNRYGPPQMSVPGPAGEQTARTQLAFSVEASRIDPAIEHVYRVCAQNDAGAACTTAPLTGTAHVGPTGCARNPS